MGCLAELNKNVSLQQKDMEYLRRDVETILSRFGKHVEDAEKIGGRHERLRQAEVDIQALHTLRRSDMRNATFFMIGSGIVGGLIGAQAPAAVIQIAHFLIGK